MKTVKINIEPKEWQRDVIEGIKQHPLNSFHVVKSRRQCGKSIMLEMILLKAACINKNSVSISMSPTLEQARKLYDEIKKNIEKTPLLSTSNGQRLILTFFNGSTILFKSAEQEEGLRGFTVKNGGIMVVDECCYIKDSVFFTALPWVNVSKAPVVLCSTPKYKTGFFYDFYLKALNDEDNFFCYDWCEYDVSEFLSEEMLEIYKKSVPRHQFLTDYLGQFLDLEGNVFGRFDSVITNDNSGVRLGCSMGIDWGTGSNGDYTAISVLNSKCEMVGLKYFNDKDETETIDKIVDMIEEFKPLRVYVEKNSIGEIFYKLLIKEMQRRNISYTSVIPFNTTNDSKHNIVSLLQVAIQNKTIKLWNDIELVTELTQYECKPSPTGKPTYNAANGFHDDILISIMLALYGQLHKSSSVMFG